MRHDVVSEEARSRRMRASGPACQSRAKRVLKNVVLVANHRPHQRATADGVGGGVAALDSCGSIAQQDQHDHGGPHDSPGSCPDDPNVLGCGPGSLHGDGDDADEYWNDTRGRTVRC